MRFFEQWTKLGEAMVEMPFVAARSMFERDGEQAPQQDLKKDVQQAGCSSRIV